MCNNDQNFLLRQQLHKTIKKDRMFGQFHNESYVLVLFQQSPGNKGFGSKKEGANLS